MDLDAAFGEGLLFPFLNAWKTGTLFNNLIEIELPVLDFQ
jgi:hypothetical protein